MHDHDPEYTDVEAPDGTRIRLWERAPEDTPTVATAQQDGDATTATDTETGAVLFVHGATYDGRSAFDVPRVSWLAATAAAGRAAYAVDVRGYGHSERPAALAAPPDEHDPIVRAETAADDAGAALAAVRGVHDTVHLVGYSWGTMTAGLLVGDRDAAVASLTQYAPVYEPSAERREEFDPGDPPESYRTATRPEARQRWADQRPDPVPDTFDPFWETLVDGQRVDSDGEEAIAAPNGTLVDLQAAMEEALYDPGRIETPTLVVRGSLDTASRRPDALALFDALGSDERTYTELAGGSHFLQLEAPRERLFGTVRGFQDRVSGR